MNKDEKRVLDTMIEERRSRLHKGSLPSSARLALASGLRALEEFKKRVS